MGAPQVRRFHAAILDLDGVLTRTADLHAQAWKHVFDNVLRRRPPRSTEDHSPFDIGEDYVRHVDGKPRLEGIRDFFDARGLPVPLETEDDSSGDSLPAIGDRKNALFLQLLEERSPEVYEDAVEQLRNWLEEGLKIAVATSSRNGRRVLRAAGLFDLPDVVVDGEDAERLGLPGKPAPDLFLHAAATLGVEPGAAILVEDSIAGVQAGRQGGFGLVVGVARNGGTGLEEAGADVVVTDLREVREARIGGPGGGEDG